MWRGKVMMWALLALGVCAIPAHAQLGKSVAIPAGSEADRQLAGITAATDPAQKLALIDKFAAANEQGDLAIVADEQYVNYYLAAKDYGKTFEFGDKIFALDPDNFSNAVNMLRAAQEKGDTEKLFAYGDKAGGILQRYKAAPAPAGLSADEWERRKTETLASVNDNVMYIEQTLFNVAYRTPEATKKAEMLVRFAKMFPDSPYADQAMVIAAASYRQAQNTPKMLEAANGLLAKDANNLGMLLLLADYYSEKGEQLDKAEAYAKKVVSLADTAKKPDSLTDEQWKQQISLQKGLALSALGQVSIQRKDNAHAVDDFHAAAPLLKPDALSYARNEYRLGFALLNLKRMPEAKAAFTEAASVDTPYKALAQEKLKGISTAKPVAKKKS